MIRVSKLVIGCAIEVHRTLGSGFLEAVYENSLAVEFREKSLEHQRQVPFEVRYKDRAVGKYVCDYLIESCLLVELKAQRQITPNCEAQLLNYLHASGIGVGLLLNFGAKSLQIKRMALDYEMAKIV